MSDHTIVIIWAVKIFCVQFFCVFLASLLISSASVRSIPFLSFIKPIFAWNVPLVSLIFLKRSLVFSIPLFSSLSLHWLLRKAFLFLLAILCNSAFRCLYLSVSPLLFCSLIFSAICKASSDSCLPFCNIFIYVYVCIYIYVCVCVCVRKYTILVFFYLIYLVKHCLLQVHHPCWYKWQIFIFFFFLRLCKTSVKYHLTPVRMENLKRQGIISVGEMWRKGNPFCMCMGWKLKQPLW